MAKSLVVVESPAKAKTINKFLGKDYIVKPTGGHIIDLPEDEFGINIEKNFEPKYQVIKGKNKTVQDIKKATENIETIYIATDPDREGEAIAWHVAKRVLGDGHKYYRVLINQITKDAVISAIENKGEIDIKKVDAQQARRVLDRLVGYKVSPVLWKTIYKGLSAGRVQSVALRLIVERDLAIESFIPEEYWTINVDMAKKTGEIFEARLVKENSENIEIKNGIQAEKISDELSSLNFVVSDVTVKKTKKQPAPPFITSTLQQEASRRIGFNVSKTMKVAQTLYEGIDIKDGTTGLITYMRTDSTRIADEAVQEVRAYISDVWGKGYLPSSANIFKTRKNAQDAHEAIRPVSMAYPPEKIKSYLTPDQIKLYQLIWNRFIACQMRPAEYDVTSVDIKAGKYGLRATSTEVTFKGFLTVYEDIKPEDEENKETNSALPKLVKNEDLENKGIKPAQHFTKPPAQYSEASLVKELESLGIGRPSTYAQIINTIQERKYVLRKSGKLSSTELGRNVNKILLSGFPALFSVDFTASMEENLDRIEAGETQWLDVVKDFYSPFNDSLEQFKVSSKELKKSLIEETEEKCEKCGKPMLIRWGKNGKFMACSGFPECRNTKPLAGTDEPLENVPDEKCEKCGSKMELKQGRYGKFLACSNYPKCKNIKSLKKTAAVQSGVKCPMDGCDGDIVQKRTKRGKSFYSCSKYPDCNFASWDRPVAVQCPECGSPSSSELKDGSGYSCLRCKNVFNSLPVEKEV